MKRSKRKTAHENISIRLGNEPCGVWPYILSIIANALLHIGWFIVSDHSMYHAMRLVVSFVFFVYPFYFVADVIWSMRPSVSAILAGEKKINRKYYTNTIRGDITTNQLLPVTISVPIFMEENPVVFETIRQSLKAIESYRETSGQSGNIVVSDDGLAFMLGGQCTKTYVDDLLLSFAERPLSLLPKEKIAAERICFYRNNGIAFVIRPTKNRAGRFKKASNLNYTLHMGDCVSDVNIPEGLFAEGGQFAGGYAEGDVRTSEVILLLDKDSGMHEHIIEAVVPEFIADAKLAYVQCATKAINLGENYFSKAIGFHSNNLFHNIWPCKALQGFFVPLVGHNVFLRKSMLIESGYWSENKVSEDYDKAMGFYKIGYHGKYAQFAGLEFTEYVSRTFVEESGKQLRYSYGLLEMIFEGTVDLRRTRGCDIFYMVLYFFSVFNSAMLLPTALFESYFGNTHLLWAGFLFCNVCFILLPCFRSISMRRRIPKELRGNLGHTSILALSFLGHTYSALAGMCKYFADKIRPHAKPFPVSNVDALKYNFVDGLKILKDYFRKNKGFLVLAALCIERGLFMIYSRNANLITLMAYSCIFFLSALVPVLLTPQLYSRPRNALSGLSPSRKKAGLG